MIGIGGYQNTSVAEGRRAGLMKALEENPDVNYCNMNGLEKLG